MAAIDTFTANTTRDRSESVIRKFFAGIADGIAQWKQYNRTYNELASLSDRDLADLGISRAEIPSVAAQASMQDQ